MERTGVAEEELAVDKVEVLTEADVLLELDWELLPTVAPTLRHNPA